MTALRATPSETIAATSEVACAHCTLPVPLHEQTPNAEHAFCCQGCRAVWHSLHEAGLSAYYELAANERATRGQAHVSGRGFEHFDRASFQETHVQERDGIASTHLRVDGLHCGACVWLLESMHGVVPGLAAARVNLTESSVELQWEPTRTSLSKIASSFDRLGYQLAPNDAASPRESSVRASRRSVATLGIAGALSVNAMGIAFGLYGGLLHSMPPSMRIFLQWWSVAIALTAICWPGRVFFTNAWTAVRTRVPHMDIPVAFGLASAVLAGIVATIRGTGAIYCEGATMLVFLLLVGRLLQATQQRRALRRVETLFAIIPALAWRIDEHGRHEVFVEELKVGDIIEVPAHETLGADGVLESASCYMDLSHLTGESAPVRCANGTLVHAGSRALERALRVRVTTVGAQTRAARIMELVREAAHRRAPICQLADALAGWFLVGVLTIAIATLLFWWGEISFEPAMERTIALLVVTCPCALGLATPLAILSGLGSAARQGMLIKGGDTFERISRAGTIVLDKTGTITMGRPAIIELDGDEGAVELAAVLEQKSAHPLARAIIESVRSRSLAEARDVVETAGEGIRGTVGNSDVAVGSARFMQRLSIEIDAKRVARSEALAARGVSPIYIAVDGECAALLGVGDAIRSEVAHSIRALREQGWEIRLASGDEPRVVASVAKQIGLMPHEAIGGLSPEQKLAFVSDDALKQPRIMVGDGINDLGALAAADCGVSVRGSAQCTTLTADVCLAGEGIALLPALLAAARRTMRTVRLNLWLSLAYNGAGAVLAFMGLVNPIVASILMPLSGLTVLATSLHGTRASRDEGARRWS